MSLVRSSDDSPFVDDLQLVDAMNVAAQIPLSPSSWDLAGSAPAQSRAKRLLDIVAATLALIVLAPMLCVIYAAIKATSRGPALFRQTRYGLNSEPFRIYKFRTMYVERSDPTGVRQTQANDDRVTPIGACLRKFNLDELPQLLNVLLGHMSLVGPRPHVPDMLAGGVKYEELVPNYFERHRVKPGITGLAQALGFRGSTEDPSLARSRIAKDLEYIENWSFGSDLTILLRTIVYEIQYRGRGV
jgi:lipopolysaccharide/colanic/teichoic acid biosynthesis glycosyltransferase